MALNPSRSLFAKLVKRRALDTAATAEQEKHTPLSRRELEDLFAYDLKTADSHLSKLRLLGKDSRFKPAQRF